ncbi:MAG: threonine--tRNA ligase, partial [Planctomycetales bacterium]|nr:threonine--tRNA ligase [Planctomycetales bacterium]
MPTVILPDGSRRDIAPNASAYDVAAEIGPGLAKAAVVGEVNGQLVDLHSPLDAEGEVQLRLLTKKDDEALAVMRHSAAHVMAQAVMRLFPGTGLAFGPVTGAGFYYDFQLDQAISEEDFPKIEAEMKKIVADDLPFERFELPRDEAIKLCAEMGQKLKVEHLETGLGEEQTVSFYRQGEFIDLCRGKHIPSTRHIGKAFKLTSVAGAYWKGDASREQLKRVYATAFFDKQELADHLRQIEEAKKRDHRVLGKQLELFTISQTVGSGLILWLPKGAIIRQTLEDYLKDELARRGYDPVYTPNIGKVELYQISGHFPYYSGSQFPLIDLGPREGAAPGEGERYLLKPMNCPHHIMIYKSEMRSYRDLPVRYAEFGTVYRYEQSGELHGLTRVRGFTVDDAHLFVTPEQLLEEFKDVVRLIQYVFTTLGLTDFRARVGIRDPESDKYVGDDAAWEQATAAIIQACQDMNLPHMVEEGEAAFYGPKLDFIFRDVLKRNWQLGTVQVDYNLPARFELEYVAADGTRQRPIMIHRA